MKFLKQSLSSPSVIVVIAFALRVLWLWWGQSHAPLPVRPMPFGYETGRIARSIAIGKGFSSPLNVDTGPTIWLTPIYPYLLAGTFKLFGVYSFASMMVAVVTNLLFSALTCYPVFYIAKRIGGTAVAVGSAWFWVFFPLAIVVPIQWVWDTSLTALFSALILWATLAIADSDRTRNWIGYGLLWGIGLMVNAALFSLAPFLLGWLAWDRYKSARHWLKVTSLAAIMMALCCVPWTIRNYVVFHQIIPFRSNFGLELWLGNNDQVPDTWSGDLHPNDYAPERAKYIQMGEIAYMHEKQREAIHFMVNHPVDDLRFFWRRFADTWTLSWDPLESVWGHLAFIGRYIMVGNLIEVLFGFFGLFMLSRQKNRYLIPLAAYPLIFPVVYYITHPSWRYRHPMDPVMIVLATFGIVFVVRAILRKKSTAISATLGGGVAENQPSIAL